MANKYYQKNYQNVDIAEQIRREEELSAAINYSVTNRLPALEGTERQKKYAIVIRYRAIEAIQKLMAIQTLTNDAAEILNSIIHETESDIWIENRGYFADAFCVCQYIRDAYDINLSEDNTLKEAVCDALPF
jgi:hypothetical protein